MSNRKSSEVLIMQPKKTNNSTDFVYYQSATTNKKIRKVLAKEIGKGPIYRFFIEYDNQYCPLRCMLDLGSTLFVISPEVAKAFSVTVVKREKPIKSNDVSGNNLKTEGLFTVLLAISFGKHR
jgi:hypothetical protein